MQASKHRRQVVTGLVGGFATFLLGFVPLLLIWELTKAEYVGMLGFPDFVSGTIGDAVLLPTIVGALLFLGVDSRGAPRRRVWEGSIAGSLAGAGIQLLWLTDVSKVRQWGVPEPMRFSLPGAWHAVFFVGVCAVLGGVASRLAFGIVGQGAINRFAAVAASTAGLAFAVTVVYDSTRGAADSSNVVTILGTLGATFLGACLVLQRTMGLSRQMVLSALSTLAAGLTSGAILIALHSEGAPGYLIAHFASGVAAVGLGFARWRSSDDPYRSWLPLPSTILAFATTGLSLPSLLAHAGNSLLMLQVERLPLSPVQSLAAIFTSLILLAAAPSSGQPLVRRSILDFSFLLAVGAAAALCSISFRESSARLLVLAFLSTTVVIAASTMPYDFDRYARWESLATVAHKGLVSSERYQSAIRQARASNVLGIAFRGVSALLIFLISVTAAAQGVTNVVRDEAWTGRATLAVALLVGLVASLAIIPQVLRVSRRIAYVILSAPIVAGLAGLLLTSQTLGTLTGTPRVFFLFSIAQGLCLGVDSAQSWVGTGRWLRGERFEGAEDLVTSMLLGFGWFVLAPLEFLLIYAGGASVLPIVSVFVVLAAVRFLLAVAAGKLAINRGGEDLASMDTQTAFRYDELFRWVVALLAIGAPALILRAMDDFSTSPGGDQTLLDQIGLAVLASTPIALLAVALPRLCRTNSFYARSQVAAIIGASGGSAIPTFSGTVDHTRSFLKLWALANEKDNTQKERFAIGLLAHIAMQNVFRTAAVLLQPFAFLGLGVDLLRLYNESGNLLDASHSGPPTEFGN